MLNTKYTKVSPVLPVLSPQRVRVTGKAAKDHPKRDRGKQSFEDHLQRAEEDEILENEDNDDCADSEAPASK